MDSQTIVLSHLCITGQLNMAQKLLNSQQGTSIFPEARKILLQALNLALNNSVESLEWLDKQQNCIAYVALYCYNECQMIKDNDKTSAIKQQISIGIQELNEEQIVYCFLAASIFNVSLYSDLLMNQLIQLYKDEVSKHISSLQLLLLSELLHEQVNTLAIDKVTQMLKFRPDKAQFQSVLEWYVYYIYKIVYGIPTYDCFEYILQREPIFSQILQEEIWCQPIMKEYYKGVNTFNLLDFISQDANQSIFQPVMNGQAGNLSQLLIQIVTNNFQSQSKKLIAINTYLQQLLKRIGNPLYNNQITQIINQVSLIYETTQDPQVLQQLIDFLAQSCNINRNMTIKQLAQRIKINLGLQTQNQQLLKGVLQEIQSLTDDKRYLNTQQEMQCLTIAAVGNCTQAKQQIQELIDINEKEQALIEEEAKEVSLSYLKCKVVSSLINLFLQQQIGSENTENEIQNVIKNLSEFLQNSVNQKIKQNVGLTNLSVLLPKNSFTDLTLKLILPKIDDLEVQQPKIQALKTQLQQICQINPSSQTIRLSLLYSLQQQSLIQQLIKCTQILSKFQNLLGKTELTLAASAAAQQGQENVAMMFLSQAVVLDSSVAQSQIYRLIQVKNLQAKKRYDEAIQVLSQMAQSDDKIDKQQVNVHILLIKIIKSQQGEDIEDSYKRIMNLRDDGKDGAEIRLLKAQLMLYLLQIGGIIQCDQQKDFDNGKMLQSIIDKYIYLFYEQQALLISFYKLLSDLGDSSQSDQSNQYYANKFGQNPLCCTDYNIGIYCKPKTTKTIEVEPKLKMIANQIINTYKITLQVVIDKLSGERNDRTDTITIKSTQEAYLLASIYQTQLNDKYSYLQTFKQLPSSIPQQIMLSEALVAVGQSKQAVQILKQAQQSLRDKMNKEALGDGAELLMNLLQILQSRSLLCCHRYSTADKFLFDKLNSIEISIKSTPLQLIVYGLVLSEFLDLQAKLDHKDDIQEMCEEQINIYQEQFNLSSGPQVTQLDQQAPNIQAVYLLIYVNKVLAENDIQNSGRLNDCVKLFDKYVKSRIAPDVTSGTATTIQQKAANSAMNLYKQIQIKIAVNIIKQTTINWNDLNSYKMNEQDKILIQNADHIISSLENVNNEIDCFIIKTIKQLFITQDFEKARTFCLQAKQLDRSNQQSNALLSIISHKMNFGNDDEQEEEQKSEKANTPFEDATEVLKNGINVNREQALDQFIINGCLVHDITVVTDCLFRETIYTNQLDINNIKETYTLTQLNSLQSQSSGQYDGYFYLGRGFLSIKMGRIEDGFRDMLQAINSQTLCDRYKARALYIMGSIYLNPGQIPVFGSQSSITGKQKSAVQLQKEAMGLAQSQDNGNDDEVQGLSQALLQHREDDIKEALEIQSSLQKLASQEVTESKELLLCLTGYIQLAQLQLIRDKIQYTYQTEQKSQAKVKVTQLEMARNEAESNLNATSENINVRCQQLPPNAPNYTLLLYINSLIFLAFNNQSKARQNLQQATKLIVNLNQAPSWLSNQAVVLAHLALADLFIQIGKISNSLKELDSIASLDKIQCCSYELYGLCMEKEGSYIDASKYYESAWLLCGGASAGQQQGNNWTSGQMDFQMSKKANISCYSIAQRLAYNYMKAGQQVEAVSVCQLCCGDDQDDESKEVQQIVNEVEKSVKK